MSEKTKLTESLVKLLGFELIDAASNRDYYLNTDNDMLVIFEGTNIPVVERREGILPESIGHFKYYEDALEAYNKVVLPQQLTDNTIDLSALRNICQEYVDDTVKNGYTREDDSHYIFETAMQTIFGEDIFDFLNKHTN